MRTDAFEIETLETLNRRAEEIDNEMANIQKKANALGNTRSVYNCFATCSGTCSYNCGGNCQGGCVGKCGSNCEGGCVAGCGGFF